MLDRTLVRSVVGAADAIVHAVAQTAVTTSVVDQVTDFETNVIGAFEVLEAARATGRPIPLVFYIDDLVKAIQTFFTKATSLSAGVVCNVGGGRGFTLSPLELLDLLERKTGRGAEISFAPSRPSDQRVYVSDIRRIGSLLGWTPETPPTAGVQAMIRCVSEHLELFSSERRT